MSDPAGWEIVERPRSRRGVGRKHIFVVYATRELAQRVLDDLLKPYPADHPWRRRLVIRPAHDTARRPGARAVQTDG